MNQELIAICRACTQAVNPDDGHLWVDTEKAEEAWQAMRAWEGSRDPSSVRTVADLMTYPKPVEWQVHHFGCTPEPCEYPYSIDLKRVDTFQKLCFFAIHIADKPWAHHGTNWMGFVHAAVDGTGKWLVSTTGGVFP